VLFYGILQKENEVNNWSFCNCMHVCGCVWGRNASRKSET